MNDSEFSGSARLVEALRRNNLTLSAAESCTGGWFAKSIVDVAGASAVFLGGVVSYTEEIKADVLGVSREALARYTAVSEPVCREMAEGVRRLMHTDLAVSVTGLAGPGGGTEEIPVGCVYIGLAAADKTTVRRLLLPGSREEIRFAAVREMQKLLITYIENKEQGDTIS